MRATSSGVGCTVRDGVAWLNLERPRAGNRIDQLAAQTLCDLVEEIEHDDSVAIVALRARGASFCLGVESGGDWENRFDWVGAVGSLGRPVVAMLDGPAVAEGCELALACDLRIAGPRARFRLPQILEGRLPSHGATQRLPRLIGRTRALDLLLTGRWLGAREALDAGLLARLAPSGKLARVFREEVAVLAAKGPIALRFAKEAVSKGLDLTLEQGVRLEQDLYVLLQTTADRAEGIRAFREKRRPTFEGG